MARRRRKNPGQVGNALIGTAAFVAPMAAYYAFMPQVGLVSVGLGALVAFMSPDGVLGNSATARTGQGLVAGGVITAILYAKRRADAEAAALAALATTRPSSPTPTAGPSGAPLMPLDM